jgi:hypothetical protein
MNARATPVKIAVSSTWLGLGIAAILGLDIPRDLIKNDMENSVAT